MAEGWLIDPGTQWVYRFHRDDKSWIRDPMVFVDKGKQLSKDEPALLKSRQHLKRNAAEAMWMKLVKNGWKTTSPLWGASAEV